MTASRLYRAVGAHGPQADMALEALPESAQRPRLVSESPDVTDPDLLLRVLADAAPDGPIDPADIPEPLAHLDGHQAALRDTSVTSGPEPAAAAPSMTALARDPGPAVHDNAPHAAPTQDQPRTRPATPVQPARTDNEPSPLARMATLAQRTPAGSVSWSGMLIVMAAAGVLLGLATALLLDGFGWFVGLPLSVLSVVLTARLHWEDRWAGAVAAPLTWLLIILGPGQLLVTHDGSPLLTQALLVAQGLSDNAIWIVLPAAIGALMARRRRFS